MNIVIADVWKDLGWIGALVFGAILLLPALLFCLFWMMLLEHGEWAQFKADHHCHVVGKMTGSMVTTVGPTFGGSGGIAIGIGSTPDKTGWLCDDGVTYWR